MGSFLFALFIIVTVFYFVFKPSAGETLGSANCVRCNGSWNELQRHITLYRKSSAYAVLCEGCWRELTPDDRRRYFLHFANEIGMPSFMQDQLDAAIRQSK